MEAITSLKYKYHFPQKPQIPVKFRKIEKYYLFIGLFQIKLQYKYKPHLTSELKTLEWDIINSEITSLNSCREQAIFKLDINYSTGYLDISF